MLLCWRSFFLSLTAFGLVQAQFDPLLGPVYGNHFGISNANETYDYVVVGGGTAGIAVATRLAQDRSKSVALVEAGGFYEVENGNVSTVPAYNVLYANTANATYPAVDWGFFTTPQTGLDNRSLHYGRGKMLGGSSAENAMIYNRGTIDSFQAWANAVGDQDWTFPNVLPFYARSTNYSFPDPKYRAPNASHVPAPRNPDAYAGGPVQISYGRFAVPFSSWTKLAYEQLGVPTQQDFSSGYLIGAQYAPGTLNPHDASRSSSQTSYLNQYLAGNQTNLKVYTHCLAKRINFSPNMTATGVEFMANGQPFTLSARREVVCSAGAFQSPQLLMVSGIGPREELEKNDIKVLVDRPGVGQNLWDHLDFGPTYRINTQGFGYQNNPPYAAELAAEYTVNRTGPLTSPGVDFLAWEKLPEPYRSQLSPEARAQLAQFPPDWPEIEYEISQAMTSSTLNPKEVYGTILSIIVAPISRGNVTLRSNDTSDLPIVNPNFLGAKTDQEMVVQIMKRARQIGNQTSILPIILEEVAPGPSVQSDADLLQFVKENSFQNWHASCTCKMGMVNDTSAVVDSRGRVIGAHGLRIADASAFAMLPPGHPVSTVYMVAEKIANYISQNQ